MINECTTRRRPSHKNKPVIKRLLANKCERERVRKINEAFEVLRKHIPYCDSGRIRTKLDVLKFAIDYIQILSKMVSQSEAAMRLKATQMEKAGQAIGSDLESPMQYDMFLQEETTAFPFNEHVFMGESSPTSSDTVFFNEDLNQDILNQFPWQPQNHHSRLFYQPSNHEVADQVSPPLPQHQQRLMMPQEHHQQQQPSSSPIPEQPQTSHPVRQHQTSPRHQQVSSPIAQQYQTSTVSRRPSSPIPQQHQTSPVHQQLSSPIPQHYQKSTVSRQLSSPIPQHYQNSTVSRQLSSPIPQHYQKSTVSRQLSAPIPQQHRKSTVSRQLSSPIPKRHKTSPVYQQPSSPIQQPQSSPAQQQQPLQDSSMRESWEEWCPISHTPTISKLTDEQTILSELDFLNSEAEPTGWILL